MKDVSIITKATPIAVKHNFHDVIKYVSKNSELFVDVINDHAHSIKDIQKVLNRLDRGKVNKGAFCVSIIAIIVYIVTNELDKDEMKKQILELAMKNDVNPLEDEGEAIDPQIIN